MASLNSVHLEKKREAYLATAKPISALLVDDTGDENYGDVPDGSFPETYEETTAESVPVTNSSFMGMRPTDIRAAQLAQMGQAEKDFYFVQGDVNVTGNTEYNTEYEDNYSDEYDDEYDDDNDDDFDDDEYNDDDIIDDSAAYDDSNEVELIIDIDDLMYNDDLDDDLNSDDDYLVVDEDGDIDDEEGYSDEDNSGYEYLTEEDEDIAEIVSLLQSMGIDDFGDDFDEDYEELTIASYKPRKTVKRTVPVTPISRPTDPDSTAIASEKNKTKVYSLLFS